jgi:hypothetical protein
LLPAPLRHLWIMQERSFFACLFSPMSFVPRSLL